MSILNLNIGILGHVDSGKTTLSKALSQIGSTAAFDKSTQSQERGITLDLGFSALVTDIPAHFSSQVLEETAQKGLQLTFVDCPGHASLIRTIIGGSQIIDFVILVIDATKGIQTQTAECIVLAEITCPGQLIVALNKIDALLDEKSIEKVTKKVKGALSQTKFKDSKVIPVSASQKIGLDSFLCSLKSSLIYPKRDESLPFLFAVDHCFAIKGQGTVCTGTVLQGSIKINQEIEIPKLKLIKKVKSIQMFKKPVNSARQGDRIGICLTQFSESNLERGVLSSPNLLKSAHLCLLRINRVKYFKFPIKSKAKFHVTVGYETVMAKLILFSGSSLFEGEYIDELQEEHESMNALLEFEKPILAQKGSLLIASKLDSDIHSNTCRLAFHGKIEEIDELSSKLKIFREKVKEGNIQRVMNDQEVIAVNLFKKESDRQIYMGLKVSLTTGEEGVIESTFGQTNKIKIRFKEGLAKETLEKVKNKEENVKVLLKFKKFLYDKAGKVIKQ